MEDIDVEVDMVFEVDALGVLREQVGHDVSDEALATLRLVVAVEELTRTISKLGEQLLKRIEW